MCESCVTARNILNRFSSVAYRMLIRIYLKFLKTEQRSLDVSGAGSFINGFFEN